MNDLDELYKIVYDKFRISEDQIRSDVRSRGLVDIRRIIAVVLLRNTRMNLKEIGAAIGRDHSSISHYKKTTEYLLETEEKLKKAYSYVEIRFRTITDGRTLEEKLKDLFESRNRIEEDIVETKEAIEEIGLIKDEAIFLN